MKQKNLVWAVAGATVILSAAGCAKTQLMTDRNITDAGDDPAGMVATTPMQPAMPMEPAMPREPMVQPLPPPVQQPPVVTPGPQPFQYQAMTDVRSTGGITSDGKKGTGSSGKAVAGKGTYIIKKGDMPVTIARKLGVRVSDLMRVNNLTEKSARRLQVGKKLIVPDVKYTGKRSGKNAKADTSATAVSGGKYTIKSGDTPERIARRFKVKLSALMQANNLTEKSARSLQVGKTLIIPGSQNLQSSGKLPANNGKTTPQADAKDAAKLLKVGEMKQVTKTISMRDFAAENNVSYALLKELNFDAEETLKAGDWVYMPAN